MEAARIAMTYRTPVFLLSDGYLANGSEPWLIPDVDSLPGPEVDVRHRPNDGEAASCPYLRDPETLARPWAVPGTPGLEHRIGGIEKEDGTGDISYDPANHDHMVRTCAAKVDRHRRHPAARGRRPDGDADAAGARLGVHLRPDHRRGPDPARRRASRSRGRTCAT